MTRWVMVADLRRCVGCQTCTASCRHANATAPGVQWRRVLDIETGEYPDVKRTFLPVGCQHCDEPPCMDVCPTTATKKRADGIVTIDYDLCIGCAYCSVACPYQARYKSERPASAYGTPMANESKRADDRTRAVATKCTFCVERIDAGVAKGLVPGVDPEATPACVNACITQTLAFGNLDDPDSNVSRLLARSKYFRMHEELGTGPGFYYIVDAAETASDAPSAQRARDGTQREPAPTAVAEIER
jgi:phenylacetyl-CoA:acceptor oxidoreductase subunit 1